MVVKYKLIEHQTHRHRKICGEKKIHSPMYYEVQNMAMKD